MTAKTIKLSEAIRQNVEQYPQERGGYYIVAEGRQGYQSTRGTMFAIRCGDEVVSCCALGRAALNGVNLTNWHYPCSSEKLAFDELHTEITYLNDTAGFTFDEIADYVQARKPNLEVESWL